MCLVLRCFFFCFSSPLFAASVAKTFFFDPAMLTQITNNTAENIGKVIDIFYIPSRSHREISEKYSILCRSSIVIAVCVMGDLK